MMRRLLGDCGGLAPLICVVLALPACDSDPGQGAARPAAVGDDSQAPMELAASHIMLKFVGAEPGRMRSGIEVTRTRDAALELAAVLAARIRDGENFEELASQYSDGPNYFRGGNLRVFRVGVYPEAMSAAIESLEIGEISDPVETQYGIHVIRRNPIERISVRQILIMHADSAHKPDGVVRSRDEAQSLSREVLARLRAGGDFAELALEHSDHSSKQQGGDLGSITRFVIDDRFVDAAFNLGIGETSDVVETGYGYHIIQRYE